MTLIGNVTQVCVSSNDELQYSVLRGEHEMRRKGGRQTAVEQFEFDPTDLLKLYPILKDGLRWVVNSLKTKKDSDAEIASDIEITQEEVDDLRQENVELRQQLGKQKGRMKEMTRTEESKLWDRVQARLDRVRTELSAREEDDREFVDGFTGSIDSLMRELPAAPETRQINKYVRDLRQMVS